MSRRHDIQEATGRITYLSGRGTLDAWGVGAPPNGVTGFSPGCIYHRVDGGPSTSLYLNEGTFLSAAWTPMSGVVRAGQTYQPGAANAKVGGTAGWTVNAANNLGTIATVAASQTAATLVISLTGLHVGDTITGFTVYASVNSGGGTVTLDANLRQLVIAAGAAATDTSIASITQVSVTAPTAVVASKTGLSTVVTAGVSYYLLLTATTGAGCTIELDQVEVTTTTS